MNRRFGISIFGVLSLTIGVLVAEYAFAPLRPLSVTSPPSEPDAESTASPTESSPVAPANPTQRSSPALELRNTAGEAEGDPMVADALARPVIDAVWQNVAGPEVQVSLASTAALVAGDPEARSTPAFGSGSLGLGGAFLGTQKVRIAAAPTPTPPVVDSGAMIVPVATVGEEPSSNGLPSTPAVPPTETVSMNDAPSAPLDLMTDPMASPDVPMWDPLPPLTPTEEVPQEVLQGEPSPPVFEDPVTPLPHVTVPEPLPASLFLLGILLGAVSLRQRRLA